MSTNEASLDLGQNSDIQSPPLEQLLEHRLLPATNSQSPPPDSTLTGPTPVQPRNAQPETSQRRKERYFINTKVNHHKTVQEMLDLYPGNLRWRSRILKHYGTNLTTKTKGKDWNEIADEWEAQCQQYPITEWVEWTTNSMDYNRIYAGFASVGREHLLPPKRLPKSFNPICHMRKLLGSLDSSIRYRFGRGKRRRIVASLAFIFGILFPEEWNVVRYAHSAWADVYMTIRVIEALFDQSLGQALRGKITCYFQQMNKEDSSGENGLKELEEQEGEEKEEEEECDYDEDKDWDEDWDEDLDEDWNEDWNEDWDNDMDWDDDEQKGLSNIMMN
jgi:hypothetical protein